jgi:hypothetical protein
LDGRRIGIGNVKPDLFSFGSDRGCLHATKQLAGDAAPPLAGRDFKSLNVSNCTCRVAGPVEDSEAGH